MTNESPTQIEKFAATDLSNLREELTQSGLDSWQAAGVVVEFLKLRGYGASHLDTTKKNFTKVRNLNELQEELASLAQVA